jgi:hypothetical protein
LLPLPPLRGQGEQESGKPNWEKPFRGDGSRPFVSVKIPALANDAALGDDVLLVVLTGFSQPEDRQRIRAVGFNAHLLKPVDLEDLQQLIARAKPMGGPPPGELETSGRGGATPPRLDQGNDSKGFYREGMSMRKVALLGVFMVSVGGLSGCAGDTHESLTREALDQMKEFVSIMDNVKDEASAQEAKPKLEALVTRMKELKKRADKLGKPSKEEDERLKKKYESEYKEVFPKLLQAAAKVRLYAPLRDIDMSSIK